jgi:hypothetical protein
MTSEKPAASAPVVAALKSFAAAHGGSATAVVEYLGRRGARIVVVGADGRWGDLVVEDVESGRAACEAAGVELVDGWGRELADSVRSTGYEWGLMGRGRPVRLGGPR